MSENRILSQEEINALLSGNLGDEPKAVKSDISELLTSLEQDALGEIGNISMGNAATSLAMLLAQDVDITTPQVKALHYSELKDMFPNPHVSIHVDYTDGFMGMNLLVLKVDDAKIIADLMMGGSGTAEAGDLSELHTSAVQEAMNQMMGSAATSMSTLFNRFVNITPPGIQLLDVETGQLPTFSEDVIIGVSFRLKIGSLIDSNIIQLIPLSFAKDMVSILLGGSEEPISAMAHESEKPVSNPMQHYVEQEETTRRDPEPSKRPEVQPSAFSFPALADEPSMKVNDRNLNLLMDISLQVSVELGRSTKKINEILDLRNGSVVELDKLAGESVDILVNNKLIAKGEVVVMDENFAVRLTEIINLNERINKLN